MVSRKEITVPEFYRNYVANAGDDNLLKALRKNTKLFRKILKNISKKKIDYAYADGKWTIRQLFQHIIDTERVFAFRALWIARKDVSAQPGFDENTWAANSKGSGRKWNDMVDEFFSIRKATEIFFSSLDDEQLKQIGTANNSEMSVAGLGFVSAGHVAHHINILEERYLKDKQKGKKKDEITEEKKKENKNEKKGEKKNEKKKKQNVELVM